MSTIIEKDGLVFPNKFDEIKVLEENKHVVFNIEPFERGFGYTIGNSLRRSLLSSIKGNGIDRVRIYTGSESKRKKVSHEYESIKGVEEDTIDIILNIKNIRLKIEPDVELTDVVLTVEKTGPGAIKAEDIETIEGIEVVNKEQHIASLNEEGYIYIEMTVKSGRGYEVRTSKEEEEIRNNGEIPLDILYSPVLRVSYKVEETRVEDRTDYDKLILEVKTDGTVTPKEALEQACTNLANHFRHFIKFEEEVEKQKEKESEKKKLSIEEKKLQDILTKSVDELELSIRASNCLKRAEIQTLGELVLKSRDEMLRTRNFGKKSLQEIEDKLKEQSLTLGMKELKYLIEEETE